MKTHFQALLLAAIVAAPFLAGAAGATPISFAGTYAQDFDMLSNTGQANTLVPPGFEYAKGTTLGPSSNPPGTATYGTGTGSNSAGNLYSFGVAGSTERAFGSVASGTTGSLRYGFGFTNTTGQTLGNLRIDYTGEQWRNSGNAAAQSLTFDYRTGAAATDNILTGTYTGFGALDFVSPTTGGSAGALNGNAAANSRFISANITGLSIANNETFWLRWTDIDNAGTDHGLAIDNFSVSSDLASVAPVPELSTGLLMLLGIGGFGMFQLAARKRKSGAGFAMPGRLAI